MDVIGLQGYENIRFQLRISDFVFFSFLHKFIVECILKAKKIVLNNFKI